MDLLRRLVALESRGFRILSVMGAWSFVRFLSFHNHGFTTGPTLCVFKLVTGYPCPFCGTTRAIAALSECHLRASFNFNPFGFFLTAAVLIWALRIKFIERKFQLALAYFSRVPLGNKVVSAVAINAALWSLDIITH